MLENPRTLNFWWEIQLEVSTERRSYSGTRE